MLRFLWEPNDWFQCLDDSIMCSLGQEGCRNDGHEVLERDESQITSTSGWCLIVDAINAKETIVSLSPPTREVQQSGFEPVLLVPRWYNGLRKQPFPVLCLRFFSHALQRGSFVVDDMDPQLTLTLISMVKRGFTELAGFE
jgi:hypothetical protein